MARRRRCVDPRSVSLPPELAPRVLVVDDHPDLRAALRDALLEVGYAVTEAEDGERGLTALAESQFDVAVVDVRMPRLDGFALLEQMRAQEIECPVVLTSVVADVVSRRRATSLGVVAFHQKPFPLGALLADLERAVAAGHGNHAAAT
jgi:two-component system response regulator MprA